MLFHVLGIFIIFIYVVNLAASCSLAVVLVVFINSQLHWKPSLAKLGEPLSKVSAAASQLHPSS